MNDRNSGHPISKHDGRLETGESSQYIGDREQALLSSRDNAMPWTESTVYTSEMLVVLRAPRLRSRTQHDTVATQTCKYSETVNELVVGYVYIIIEAQRGYLSFSILRRISHIVLNTSIELRVEVMVEYGRLRASRLMC